MNGAIKAIETLYKGYRMRSRLEARWAVFFDALGVQWEYEKEGYDLGEDGWYLPDFWLPNFEWWIEIKPSSPSVKEISRIQTLAERTGFIALLVNGSCWPQEYDIDIATPQMSNLMVSWKGYGAERWQWALCDNKANEANLVVVEQANGGRNALRYIGGVGSYTEQFYWPWGEYQSQCRLMQAYIAARSARFEHGESPRF